MIQIDTTQAVDVWQYDEDDALDSWLASLRTSEFEQFLNRLADEDADLQTAVAG